MVYEDYLVTNLEVKSSNLPNEIKLLWELPTVLDGTSYIYPDDVMLRRKRFSHPESVTDGELVASGNSSLDSYTDSNLDDQTFFCYTIFTNFILGTTDVWYFDDTTQGFALSCKDFELRERLKSSIPRYFIENDENGNLDNFLNLFADQFNFFWAYIEASTKGIHECHPNIIETFLKSHGFEYQEELPLKSMRKAAENFVQLYKWKGTETGLKYLFKILTNWDIEVIEGRERCLFFLNPEYSYGGLEGTTEVGYLDYEGTLFDNTADQSLRNTENDPNYYMVSPFNNEQSEGGYGLFDIIIYIKYPAINDEQKNLKENVIKSVINNYIPQWVYTYLIYNEN